MKSGRSNDRIMLIVSCSICGADMECPVSMINSDRHFCEECTGMMGKSCDGPVPVWKGVGLN